METTFITIHDLSSEARILYSSDSIVDILGYSPDEVINRPTWDFFHHEELPFARAKHGKGVEMDKAAVLSYCRLRDKDGHWLGCEVVFTVVYDVMVGCTSIYRRGMKSQSRAIEAPAIRRLFSNSPRDPRYHMLSHLSSKFELPPIHGNHEPRAALFLNRYTRTLTIMYATDGLADVLGITGEEMRGKSFYYCIEENCLQDAVRCLENAKANDSIAYLRFWYRDPRQQNSEQWHEGDIENSLELEDEEMGDATSVGEESAIDDDVIGSFSPSSHGKRDESHETIESGVVSSTDSVEPVEQSKATGLKVPLPKEDSRASSGRSSNPFSHEAVFGEPDHNPSSSSSMSNSPMETQSGFQRRWRHARSRQPIELEAVVSCTSDGLVVCLRRARPAIPQDMKPNSTQTESVYANGFFAVPWATDPVVPPPQQIPQYTQPPEGVPPLLSGQSHLSPVSPHSKSGPDDFMHAIRDIVVFAWALVGINGCLAEYGHGKPRGEAQPASGLPIWQPETQINHVSDGMNSADGRSSLSRNSGISSAASAGTPQQMRAVTIQDHEMANSHESSTDGINANEVYQYYDGSETDGYNNDVNSPTYNYSYNAGAGRSGQNRAFSGSDSVSPLKDQTPYSRAISLGSKDPWQSIAATRDIMMDRNDRYVDGVGNHYDHAVSDTGSGYAKNSNGNPYGFGDPGLSSRSVKKMYGSDLTPMVSQHGPRQGDGTDGAGGGHS